MFIDLFDKLMKSYKIGIEGLLSQRMDIVDKKISILSDNVILLTASGTYSATTAGGQGLSGKFAWSFVYSKVNGKWKVIHSHMSNPQRM